MKKQDVWLAIIVGLAIGGFIWAINERTLRITTENKSKRIEKDYLKLLESYFNKQKDIPDEVKRQLLHLRERFVGINDAAAIELKTIIDLIENNKEEIAIEKLTKVIENLLKQKYVKAGHAKDIASCPKLFKILERALELKWITKHEFHFSCFLKDQRNTEAHELAISFPNNWKIIAFFSGIEILYNLKGIPQNKMASH